MYGIKKFNNKKCQVYLLMVRKNLLQVNKKVIKKGATYCNQPMIFMSDLKMSLWILFARIKFLHKSVINENDYLATIYI